MINKSKSEFSVITKAKDLSSYVFTITLKSPKFFRFSLVSKMHSLCLSIIENIIRANDVLLDKNDIADYKLRNDLQNKALTDLYQWSFYETKY